MSSAHPGYSLYKTGLAGTLISDDNDARELNINVCSSRRRLEELVRIIVDKHTLVREVGLQIR